MTGTFARGDSPGTCARCAATVQPFEQFQVERWVTQPDRTTRAWAEPLCEGCYRNLPQYVVWVVDYAGYLVDAEPDDAGGVGSLDLCKDPARARTFCTAADALAYCTRVSTVQPTIEYEGRSYPNMPAARHPLAIIRRGGGTEPAPADAIPTVDLPATTDDAIALAAAQLTAELERMLAEEGPDDAR